jgi:hypothetical protein
MCLRIGKIPFKPAQDLSIDVGCGGDTSAGIFDELRDHGNGRTTETNHTDTQDWFA